MKIFPKMTNWSPILYLTLAMGLVACSDNDNDSDKTAPSTNTIEFQSSLSPNEVPVIPAIVSNASGSFSFSLNSNTHVLSGGVNLEGIVATNAHIHSGGAGKSGAVVVTLSLDNAQNRFVIPSNTVLTTEQEQALMDGMYYVNVHSQAFPGGELRGQILPQGNNLHVVELSTQELLSPVTSSGSARAFFTVDESNGDINAVLKIDGITATNAHIHDGYAGNNGGVVLPFVQSSDPTLWEIVGQSLTSEQLTALGKGRYYLNVHTQANPTGELRGQILTSQIETNIVALQAVDGVVTAASGMVYSTINKTTGLLTTTVRTSGITITAMHLHNSANNGIVVGLMQSSDAAVWETVETQLSETQVNELLQGNYYVNVHSAANQAGELRAAIF